MLWEKEKLLVTSNFSFSHSVFERLVRQTSENQGLFWKELMHKPYHTIRSFFIRPWQESFLSRQLTVSKTWLSQPHFRVYTCMCPSRFVWITTSILNLSQTTNFRLFQTERHSRRQFRL